MISVGLTEGIGSGKTTVARLFELFGTPIFYSDQVAKDLINSDAELIEKIKNLIGDESYVGARYNRKYVASIVFHDKEKLEQLNQLIHPAVRHAYSSWAEKYIGQKKYVINEAALFFENGSYKTMDKIISVTASEELRIKRVTSRDDTKLADVQARIKNQWPQEIKDKLADFLIINNGDQLLIPQVLKIHRILSK